MTGREDHDRLREAEEAFASVTLDGPLVFDDKRFTRGSLADRLASRQPPTAWTDFCWGVGKLVGFVSVFETMNPHSGGVVYTCCNLATATSRVSLLLTVAGHR